MNDTLTDEIKNRTDATWVTLHELLYAAPGDTDTDRDGCAAGGAEASGAGGAQ